MLGGHQNQKRVALDQADGPLIVVDNGNGEGINFSLEALKNLRPERRS